MAIGAVTARIITQYSDKGSKAAARDIKKLGGSFDKFAGKVGKAFAIGAAAAGAFAVKIGVDSVKAAIADEKSQGLLANSLRNTTGATDAAIAATEAWIDQTQRAYGVVDDDLRPALSKLAAMTGSVTNAQKLLGLAIDVSAGGGVDLNAATNAVTKALQGNYKALKNLGVPITDAMVKSKDLNAVLQLTAKTFAGAASTRANTFEFRMKRLGIAFDEAKESLGTALMPALEELFAILVTKVIPAIQTFLAENGDKLVGVMTGALKAIIGFGYATFKVFQFVAKNKNIFVALGAVLAATFVASKVIAFVTAIQALVKAYKAIRAAALGAAAAQAAATGGISVAAAVAGVAAFAATLGGLYLIVDQANNAMDKMEGTGKDVEFTFDGLNGTTDDFLKSLKGLNVELGKTTGASKALTKEQKLVIALQAAIKKLSGSAPTSETDPIQLEAARLNLIKQGNIAEAQRIAQLLQARAAAEEAAIAAQRYTDILLALADAKIVPAEFELLATKWGVTTSAARLYIEAIVSIQDATVSAGDIANLAENWGVTYKQAKIYLDFFQALNDGTLSDAEIANLQKQWGFTSKKVTDYSSVFAAADDGKIDYTEIVGLATKWGMTTTEAEAYAKKILEDFGFNTANLDAPISIEEAWVAAYGSADAYDTLLTTAIVVDPSLIEPGNTAAKAWKAAYDQALEYQNLIAKKAYDTVNPPATLAEKAYAEYLNGLQAKADAAFAALHPPATPAEKAYADYLNNLTEKTVVVPDTNTGITGFPLKVNTGLRDFLDNMPALATGGIVTSPTTALIGEAGPEAIIPLNRMGSMGGSTVNVVINGSVTSEGDLVNAIRNALLQGQNNGQAITKTAIQL